HGSSCQVPDAMSPRRYGRRRTELPGNCLNCGFVLRTLAAIVVAAGLACAAAPAAEQTHAIPFGVTVAGLHVGGESAEPARAAIEAAFMRPLTMVYDGRTTTIDPTQVGATIDVNAAVASA